MKSNKLFEEKREKITDYKVAKRLGSKEKMHKHPMVVYEDDENYMIVKEFSSDAKAGVVEKIDRIDPNLAKDENGEEIYYAEEIFDAEDELYTNELHDTKVVKERFRTYAQIGKEIDECLVEHGYRGDVGFYVLAAMKFSRFIFYKESPSAAKEVKAIVESMSDKFYCIDYTENIENIAYHDQLFKIFGEAKEKRNKPVFIYVRNMPSRSVFNFLRPIYPYIDNPNGDNYVVARGRSMFIPHNVWFIFSIREEDFYYDVSRRLLRYSSILNIELTETSTADIEKPRTALISIEELNSSFRDATEEYSINEESWKQIDEFVAYISKVNNFVLQNKIVRSLEDYMILLKVKGLNDEQILDVALANNFISEAIITSSPEKYAEEYPLDRGMDLAFGEDKLPRCREIVKSYVSSFNKEGNRVDE